MIITNNYTIMITREIIEEEIKLFALFIDSNKNIEEVHLEHSFAEILRPHSKRIQRLEYIASEAEDELFHIKIQENYNYSNSFEALNEKSGRGQSIINIISQEFYGSFWPYNTRYSFSHIVGNLFIINKRLIEREIRMFYSHDKKELDYINQIMDISKEFISKTIHRESAVFIKPNIEFPEIVMTNIYIRDNLNIYKINLVVDYDEFRFDNGELGYDMPEIQTYKLGSGDIIEDFELEASEEAFDLLLMMEL